MTKDLCCAVGGFSYILLVCIFLGVVKCLLSKCLALSTMEKTDDNVHYALSKSKAIHSEVLDTCPDWGSHTSIAELHLCLRNIHHIFG